MSVKPRTLNELKRDRTPREERRFLPQDVVYRLDERMTIECHESPPTDDTYMIVLDGVNLVRIDAPCNGAKPRVYRYPEHRS